MKILITNDDGYQAEGINILFNMLNKNHDVFIFAPDRERSASSHCMTLHQPLRIKEISNNIFAVTGMPTDCILIALNGFLKEMNIDIILSGINHGPNLGEDIFYSGTVAGAFEGAMWNKSGIAISVASFDEVDFSGVRDYLPRILQELYPIIKKNRFILNINFPNIPSKQIKGIRITKLGTRRYDDVIVKKKDPRGKDYYWIGGQQPLWKNENGTDYMAINDNYISITPLKIDITDYKSIDVLKKEFNIEL